MVFSCNCIACGDVVQHELMGSVLICFLNTFALMSVINLEKPNYSINLEKPNYRDLSHVEFELWRLYGQSNSPRYDTFAVDCCNCLHGLFDLQTCRGVHGRGGCSDHTGEAHQTPVALHRPVQTPAAPPQGEEAPIPAQPQGGA